MVFPPTHPASPVFLEDADFCRRRTVVSSHDASAHVQATPKSVNFIRAYDAGVHVISRAYVYGIINTDSGSAGGVT
jgi:hypothetical protein